MVTEVILSGHLETRTKSKKPLKKNEAKNVRDSAKKGIPLEAVRS